MATTTAPPRLPSVSWLIESRPPSVTWSRRARSQPNQPPLDLVDHGPDDAEAIAPDGRSVRATTVKAGWAAKPRPGLPDAQEWSTTLALAVTQALVGQRPVSHPNRSKGGLAGTGNLRPLLQARGLWRRHSVANGAADQPMPDCRGKPASGREVP
jgi:hypothetical protein